MPPLEGWANFYLIVGGAAAALTGLQFVVVTLVAQTGQARGVTELAAFGTPTVVHFAQTLLLAALMTAPWRSLVSLAVVVGILGGAGLAYGAVTLRRARRATGYTPVLEDWVFHVILPGLANATLLVAAALEPRGPRAPFFAIGAAALLLLVVGIHNAWDTVTYIVVADPDAPATDSEGEE